MVYSNNRKQVGINLYRPYTYNSGKYLLEQEKKQDEYFGKTEYYFAYGSNLNLLQMQTRCPDAQFIGQATKKNWRLVFRGVADIEPHKGSTLVGGIFKISKSDEVALDTYEGYPNLYKKDFFDFSINGKEVKVMYYYMVNSSGLNTPHISYYRTIHDGFIDCGMDTKYLEQALKYTQANIRELDKCHIPKKYRKRKWRFNNAKRKTHT